MGRIMVLNNVADPYHLPPGTRLRIPVAWMRRQPAPVRVASVNGEARVTAAEGKAPRPVTQGMALHSGASVIAGPEATVVLEFADGSRFTLRQGGSVTLDTVSAYGDSGMVDVRLRLQRPAGGNYYYMRYAVIGRDGEQGPFSTIQRILLPVHDYTPFVIFTLIGVLMAL